MEKQLSIIITPLENGYLVVGEDTRSSGIFGLPNDTGRFFYATKDELKTALPEILDTTLALAGE